ncbi:MAG: hypothetical protein JO217_03510 [Acidobacteriaceae bacterium]|nr:hypothetical protein [Acidobacteriaceae bacterium]
MLSGHGAPELDADIYVAMNMYWDALPFRLPKRGHGGAWTVEINTSMPSPDDIFDPGQGPAVSGDEVIAGPRSIIVLTANTHS